MKSRYEVTLSAQAESTYRELHSDARLKSHFESLNKIIRISLTRNPTDERFMLAGKLSKVYRIKQNGIIVDYLVISLKVKIICICLSDDNVCDGVQLLNSMVQSGRHQQILRDLGLPETLLKMTPAEISSLPQ